MSYARVKNIPIPFWASGSWCEWPLSQFCSKFPQPTHPSILDLPPQQTHVLSSQINIEICNNHVPRCIINQNCGGQGWERRRREDLECTVHRLYWNCSDWRHIRRGIEINAGPLCNGKNISIPRRGPFFRTGRSPLGGVGVWHGIFVWVLGMGYLFILRCIMTQPAGKLSLPYW